jgi:hypothetical protein
MLANFIELLAEILVESLNRPEHSADRVSCEARASVAAVKESKEAGMEETPQPVVPETAV